MAIVQMESFASYEEFLYKMAHKKGCYGCLLANCPEWINVRMSNGNLGIGMFMAAHWWLEDNMNCGTSCTVVWTAIAYAVAVALK